MLICGFLSDADPLDDVRIITTEKDSEEIWMCELNLVQFCRGSYPLFRPLYSDTDSNLVAAFYDVVQECDQSQRCTCHGKIKPCKSTEESPFFE